MSTVVELLRRMVAIPSVSGEEEACRDDLAAWLRDQGIEPRIIGRNVVACVEGRRPGPGRGLLLCSHIDVVPVGDGWTDDPWSGALRDGRILGRGSNDAKSSVAAMAVAATRLDPDSFAGRLVLAFVCDEETGGEGIEFCGQDLPAYDAAVVGEPTELDVCPGQRGLLRATLHAHGRQCHASRPWEGENALAAAARDITALCELELPGHDPLLGPPTLVPTVIHGGTRANVLPGAATIELDGRPTPGCDNERLVAILRETVECEVEVRSNRYLPVRTADDAEIVRLARAASPTGTLRGFGGVSDLFHLRQVPGIVCGPGTSAASHAPDEWVAVDQVEAAVETYLGIAQAYLTAAVPAGAVGDAGAAVGGAGATGPAARDASAAAGDASPTGTAARDASSAAGDASAPSPAAGQPPQTPDDRAAANEEPA